MKRALITVTRVRGGTEEVLMQAPLDVALPPPPILGASFFPPVTMSLFAYPNSDRFFDSILVSLHGKSVLRIQSGESIRVSLDLVEVKSPEVA